MTWILIVAVALVTFLMRLSFIATITPHAMPARLQALLRYIAPAVLAAIVLPAVLIRAESLQVGFDNPRLLAAAAAFAIAALTKSVVGTIVGGMAVLWTLQWLMP
jgi:branched-subunit amino acid transport protein